MLPERYRRLLKRRLRRRPLLPFLLAATLAVDAVIVASGRRESPITSGFLVAPLGLLAIWATASPRRLIDRLLVAMVGLLVLIAAFAWIDRDEYGVLPPVLASILLVQCVAAAAVHAAARALAKRPRLRGRARFSVGTLLLATLLVAGVATFSRFGDWSGLLDVNTAFFIADEMFPPAVMLALAYASPPGWRRLALLVGLPLACVAFCWPKLSSNDINDALAVHYSVQALVVGVWLAAIRVRCRPEAPALEESATIGEASTAQASPEETPSAEPVPMTIPMRFDSSV